MPRRCSTSIEECGAINIGTYLGFGLEYIMACAALTLGGVLDEFPNLRFCFFEAGASWMPDAMYGADRRERRASSHDQEGFGRTSSKPRGWN